ncbi:MAG TPA: hypothetical protein VM223_01040 [Planctomycetota bacterium]|nr:hypothetical protein [Planctomycetota bacterium]
MSTKAKCEICEICEFTDSRGVRLKVDREKGIIEGVKILGLESANGRTYPKQTIAAAARLYEGSKVNLNHPDGNPTQPRDYRDRLGTMREVRIGQGDGGLFADFHFNPKHPIAEQLFWDAEHSPENVGFSHNVAAKVSRSNGKVVVEEITRVQSVDLVADPATTKGLYEHAQDQDTEDGDMPATLESLQADQPDLLKSIRETAVKEHVNSESVKTEAAKNAATIKTLTEENDRLKAAETMAALKVTVEKELAEAKLPEPIVSDVFREQLYGAKDPAARKALIEDRQAIAKMDGSGKPLSTEQGLTEGKGERAKPADVANRLRK